MDMRYRLEFFDPWHRRLACFSEDVEIEATRRTPDQCDSLRCTTPHVPGMGPGCRAELHIENQRRRSYVISSTRESWNSDVQIEHHEGTSPRERMQLEGATPAGEFNTAIRRTYVNAGMEYVVRDIINRAPGALHYCIAHEQYPDGACREYAKLLARITPENELEQGGIANGQWVGADRMDVSDVFVKDGDTIAGLRVDGVAWPDVRLMMMDAEETALNSHARSRHPETGFWSAERYAGSAYKYRADLAKNRLQELLQSKGLSHIELNPHRDASGAFDDRVDAYGRYIGMVYGGGECFNAALVEMGVADVYLYADGRYHVPEHGLKDFFSYAGVHSESCVCDDTMVHALDLDGGALDALTLMACYGNRYIFSVMPDGTVSFGRKTAPDHVLTYRADQMRVESGFTDAGMVNWMAVTGHPRIAPGRCVVFQGDSIGAYGLHAKGWNWKWLGADTDKERLAAGLLADLAYPSPTAAITFYHGSPHYLPGEQVVVSGAPLARLAHRLPGEWQSEPSGTLAGRIVEVRHLLSGRQSQTRITLAAPLRSCVNPIAALKRLRANETGLFALHLDDPLTGLDCTYFELH